MICKWVFRASGKSDRTNAAHQCTVAQSSCFSPALSVQESHLSNIQTWNFHAKSLTGF